MTCDCEFDPYPDADFEDNDPSWHYRRKCLACGFEWYGVHCPHDGAQNPCPSCGIRPKPVKEAV